MSNIIKKIFFFTLLLILYVVFFIFSKKWTCDLENWTGKFSLFFTACIFTLVLFGFYSLTNMDKSETYCGYRTMNQDYNNNNLTFTPGKIFQGGAYMCQGDSEYAKKCREFASTPEGMEQINRYNCGKGLNGRPGRNFKFTPLSNACYKNERCQGPNNFNVEDNGIF